jgi:hypothetical protein
MDQPELIVCEDCGTLNERATALFSQIREDVQHLERELRAKRAKISRLEADRFAKLRKHKRFDDAIEVLEHWRAVCMPSAREIASEDRLTPVLARLSGGRTVEELKLCATGYARRPYVTKEGRASQGRPSEWFADAELIYRKDENVRRGIALAATTKTDPSPGTGDMERIPWKQVQLANRRLIVRALTKKFGDPYEDNGYLAWPCPRCDNHPMTTLRVAPVGMTWLADCSACGLNELLLIPAITED